MAQLPHLVDQGISNARAGYFSRLFSYRTAGRLGAILDYILIVAASVVAGIFYHFLIESKLPDIKPYVGIGNVAAILFVLLSISRGRYHPIFLSSFRSQIHDVLFAWTGILLFVALLLFLLKAGASYSRGALASFSLIGFCLVCFSRLIIHANLSKALERGTLDAAAAVVIGDRETLMGLTSVQILQKFGFREADRFLIPSVDEPTRLQDVISLAIESARSLNVEAVLVALQWSDAQRRTVVCAGLQALPVSVFLLPDKSIAEILSKFPERFELALEVQRPPLRPVEFTTKRMLDIVLGGAMLVGLVPLLAIVSLLVKAESPGPVIFRQQRKGFNGREFNIYKFRTMSVLENGHEIRQAKRNDPRVTGVGRILRATSIDELPQLVNVLRGEMSLVGPRPHAVAHDNGYSKLIANYAFRQHVKPGLTGWAQIHGFRGETPQLELMEQRVALDLWYIKNWSIWLDLRIIALTCFELLRRQEAY